MSIEAVISPQLLATFRQRKKEIESVPGGDAGEIIGFHGTSIAALQQIVQSGFRVDHQLNNAFGKGTYFARDPIVSVGYSASKGMPIA